MATATATTTLSDSQLTWSQNVVLRGAGAVVLVAAAKRV